MKERLIVAVLIKLFCISLHWLLYVSHHKYPIELQCYRLKSDRKLILLCFDIFALFNVHGHWFFVIVETELKFVMSTTGYPRSLQECGCDSWLQAVLCYKRLFTKGCMGCEWFFKKREKMFCVFLIKLVYLIALLYLLLFNCACFR